MFQSTLGKLQSEISGQRALDYVAQIIGHHRIQASPGFRAAAAWCEQTLAANGIAHRIHSYTYDGHANYWASQSFEEWEGIDGTLDIVAPVTAAKRLCDFSALKISLIQRSAATPPGGVEADLVLLEDPENEAAYAALDLHGRLVLARGDLDRIRDLAVRKGGALGIVSDQMPEFPPVRERTDVPDARMYTSFWWTDPAEAKCFGFVLSPRQGDALRKLVKAENLAGRQVRVKAHVASRFYTGAIENVEGFIPGATDEEVLVVAHLCHPQASANDNASGCAAALEALRAIARLIGSGALPRPRRSIRLLLVPEFAGTYAFLAKNEGLIPKIVGGINLDMVGENQELCGSSFLVEKPPLALGSFAGDLAALILEAVASDVGNLGGTASYGLFRHAVTPFSGGSDHQALADPTVGVPCPMLIQWPDKFYHTSHDTLDKVDPKMLARAAAITATYAYFVAAAGDHEVAWLAGELAAGFAAQLATAGRAIIAGRDQRDLGERLAFLRDCRFADVTSLERLRDGSAADLAATASAAAKQRIKVEHAAGLAHYAALVAAAPVPHTVPAKTPLDDPAYAKVPRRTVRGPIGRREMFAKLSTADKQEWMTKAGQLAGAAGKDLRAIYGMAGTALFWTDGRRTLAEIAHLVTMESGWCDVAILHHLYEALARQGWIEYLD